MGAGDERAARASQANLRSIRHAGCAPAWLAAAREQRLSLRPVGLPLQVNSQGSWYQVWPDIAGTSSTVEVSGVAQPPIGLQQNRVERSSATRRSTGFARTQAVSISAGRPAPVSITCGRWGAACPSPATNNAAQIGAIHLTPLNH
jgi:hypothetical protein